ncbi:hypothetical protein [Chelatococcus reniformis]|uniref:Uncharacterized protein n=1 Tax=Chelatococcus reniformis TaxID=1494448 RepID=A0A916UD48_9HYPH|nr:hypothetical protein [Chelatococcus reniformis]GGC67952.1 hypothetical protein GCM10010994_28130 [Chelatococcus reniformis]
MTRDEALAIYRPMRASVPGVLGTAIRSCGRADIMRAAKHIGLWTEDGPITDLPGAVEMLSDVALFEPNQRGRRAYDPFLSKRAAQLGAAERALAERMAGAFFSLFRNAGPHEAAGIWLEDLLAGDRRLWLMDGTLEVAATESMTFGLRVRHRAVPRRIRDRRAG